MRRVLRNLFKLIIRLYPFLRGGVKLSQMSLPKYLSRDKGLILTRLRRGPLLLTILDDYVGRTIYYWGDYDRKITYLCKHILRPNDCVLDVGACFGEVELYAAQEVGALGQVHMFEHQAKLANYIRLYAELNGFDHIHTHEVALSDKDGDFGFNIPVDNMGMGSLSEQGGTNKRDSIVKARNASKYFYQLSLPPIRLIKLDVEGHEEAILFAAFDFLKTNKPAAIIFESHDDGTQFFQRGAVKILSALGYNFYQIRQKPLIRFQLRRVLNGKTLIETG